MYRVRKEDKGLFLKRFIKSDSSNFWKKNVIDLNFHD